MHNTIEHYNTITSSCTARAELQLTSHQATSNKLSYIVQLLYYLGMSVNSGILSQRSNFLY